MCAFMPEENEELITAEEMFVQFTKILLEKVDLEDLKRYREEGVDEWGWPFPKESFDELVDILIVELEEREEGKEEEE